MFCGLSPFQCVLFNVSDDNQKYVCSLTNISHKFYIKLFKKELYSGRISIKKINKAAFEIIINFNKMVQINYFINKLH